jgi:excinuclease UvrABC nuclease subunit
LFTPPSLAFRVAAELPGIGWERAGAVSRRFTTVRQMVDAEADEWLTVPGIGKTIAARAVAALQKGQT